MLTQAQLRALITRAIDDRAEQGFATDELTSELDRADSFDALHAVARKLDEVPMRPDWPYVEPADLDEIRGECHAVRPATVGSLSASDAAARIEAAFYGRLAGCMLGKPFEIGVELDEIRTALLSVGEWPLRDYASEAVVAALPRRQGQWTELVREHLAHVVPDDDINYTILAMVAVEEHGSAFTHDDMRRLWMINLPIGATFGPERTQLVASGTASLTGKADVVLRPNPGEELCGALIRADAYGFAGIGNPELASELAYRDATFTHARTGVYGAMFVAAAIAVAPFAETPMDIVRTAVRFVPQRSRFAESVRASISEVEAASDWLDGYGRVHAMFGEYGFCRIVQEIATVINTLRFAADAGDGICMQVMQGLDTDSFGATAGSILGAYFGAIDSRWIEPFNDDLHTALASFHERSLAKVAARMAALPSSVR